MRIAAPLAARRGTPNSTFSMPVTPGWTSAKLYGLRATSGRLCTSRSVIVWPMSMRATSSAVMSELLTVIVSLTVPTDSVALTVAVCPTDNWMSVPSNFLNPCSSATTRYLPSGSSGARYRPFSFDTTERSVPVSTLVMVTVTPGSTPPELSETMPSMAPFAPCDCANAGAVSDSDSRAERTYLSMSASIQKEWRTRTAGLRELPPKCEGFVHRIHFFEVLSQEHAAGEISARHAVARIPESEQ